MREVYDGLDELSNPAVAVTRSRAKTEEGEKLCYLIAYRTKYGNVELVTETTLVKALNYAFDHIEKFRAGEEDE
jgi:hypothetical protein